jgi:site-specific recombinase XerD
MLDAGVDPLVIQQVLGHSKVSMTAHYARSGDELRQSAVDALGRAIG